MPPSRSASGLQCPFWDMNVDASLTRHIEVLANGWLTASAGRPECANAQLCIQMAQRHLHARSEQHLAVFGSLGGVAQNCACLIGGKGERGSLQSSPCGRRCTQMCERDGTVGPRLCVRIGGGGGPSIEYVAGRGGVAVAKVGETVKAAQRVACRPARDSKCNRFFVPGPSLQQGIPTRGSRLGAGACSHRLSCRT